MINLYHADGFYKIQAPEFLSDAQDWFTKTAIKEVKSNDGGFKTSLGDYSLGQADGEGVKGLESAQPFMKFLEEKGAECLREMGYQVRHPLKVKNLWINEMASGQYHPLHAHYGYVLSGTFYVDMPPGCPGIILDTGLADRHCASIPVDTYNLLNSSTWSLQPEVGDLMMWLSYVRHHVPASEFEGIRRSVAFDLSF